MRERGCSWKLDKDGVILVIAALVIAARSAVLLSVRPPDVLLDQGFF